MTLGQNINKYCITSFIGSILIVAFSSCSFDKRVYTAGYHIEWNHTKTRPQTAILHKRTKIDTLSELTIENCLSDDKIASTALEENLSSSLAKSVIISDRSNIYFHSNTSKIVEAQIKAIPIIKTNIKKQEKRKNIFTILSKDNPGKKNKIVALLLCLFLGLFGIHRFYLGYTGKALVQILFLVFGVLLSFLVGILISGPFSLLLWPTILLFTAVLILLLIWYIGDLVAILLNELKPKGGDYDQN
jgi:hypothetical protein